MASAPGAAGPGAPFPQWTVTMDAATGYPVAEVINAQEKAVAEAVAFPTRIVFFTSQAAASAYSKSLHGSGQTTPAARLGGQAALNAGAQAAAAVSNPLDWLSNIGQFFSALTQPNLWLRVTKVLIGGVMVVAGLMKLTGTDRKVYGLAGAAAAKLPGV